MISSSLASRLKNPSLIREAALVGGVKQSGFLAALKR
jgi:hypothetical protein